MVDCAGIGLDSCGTGEEEGRAELVDVVGVFVGGGWRGGKG